MYKECGSACPPTCEQPTFDICAFVCVRGCQCPSGTVLDGDRCILPEDCECSLKQRTSTYNLRYPSFLHTICMTLHAHPGGKKCSIPGQVFMECGSACPPTCEQPTFDICAFVCVRGCQCPSGTVLDGDRCILPEDCECSLKQRTSTYNLRYPLFLHTICMTLHAHPGGKKCSIPGQVFMECGSACPPTCEQPTFDICALVCVRNCQCPSGTVLDGDRCILPEDCECSLKQRTSTYNLRYPSFLHTLCMTLHAHPGGKKCSIPGQVFMECGTACPPTCADPSPSCTRQCVRDCQCPSGTVLHRDHCVLPEHCEYSLKQRKYPSLLHTICFISSYSR